MKLIRYAFAAALAAALAFVLVLAFFLPVAIIFAAVARAQDAGVAAHDVVAAVCGNQDQLTLWLSIVFGTSFGASVLSNWSRIHSIPYLGTILRFLAANWSGWLTKASVKAGKSMSS